MTRTSPPPALPHISPTKPAPHPVAAPKPKSAPILPEPAPEPAVTYDYSSTQIDLPADIAMAMRAFGSAIPKEKLDEQEGLETDPHITVKYGNPSADPTPIAAALADEPPVEITFGPLSIFKGTDGGPDVLKVGVTSQSLHHLNDIIGKAVEHTGNTFPDFNPHATIGYFKPGEADEYGGQDVPGVSGETIVVSSVVFSGSDGKMTAVPLGGQPAADDPPESAGRDERILKLAAQITSTLRAHGNDGEAKAACRVARELLDVDAG